MNLIKESTWELVKKYTWKDLSNNKWSDFYLVLMESDKPEIRVDPVKVKNVSTIIDIDLVEEIKVNPILVGTSRINIDTDIDTDITGVKVYYNQVVIQTWGEMIINIITSERDYMSAMLNYLPWYERESQVFINILNAYAYEFIRVEQDLSAIELNQFIDTAVEMLSLYERELGIGHTNELDYRQRREQIISYLRGIVGQTTEGEIKNIARSYTNGEIEINRTNEAGVFEIKFIDEVGVPDNIEGLKKAINKVIPAHLKFSYHYQYNLWEKIGEYTWEDVEEVTWNELREEVI